MNLAAVFTMLVQLGVCAPMHFTRPDHTDLTVLVCPFMSQQAPAEQAAPVPEPSKKQA